MEMSWARTLITGLLLGIVLVIINWDQISWWMAGLIMLLSLGFSSFGHFMIQMHHGPEE
jgi:Mg/Co/Ni transporter MgtE